MDASQHTLTSLLALAGLIAATIEYAEILRRRSLSRRVTVERDVLEASGLRGMVRVFVADESS